MKGACALTPINYQASQIIYALILFSTFPSFSEFPPPFGCYQILLPSLHSQGNILLCKDGSQCHRFVHQGALKLVHPIINIHVTDRSSLSQFHCYSLFSGYQTVQFEYVIHYFISCVSQTCPIFNDPRIGMYLIIR